MTFCRIYNVLIWIFLFLSTTNANDKTASIRRATIADEDFEQLPRHLQSGLVGQISKFQLINANPGNTGQVLIENLVNGAVIDLVNYPPNQLFSIAAVANTTIGPVGSVRFQFAGKNNFRTESGAPYALCGDNGPFKACSQLVVGSHTVGATPYSGSGATGVIGTKVTISFSIVNSAVVPTKAPTKSPTKSPTKAPTVSPTKAPTKSPTKIPTKSPTSAPTPEPGWIVVQPNSTLTVRHEACFVMVGRKAYLLAGRSRKVVSIYDPVTGIWTEGLRPPIQIHHTQCVVADDKIWIVSSWTGGYPMETNTAFIYIYNPATNTWSTKAGLPEPRRRGGAASVVVGRRIYVSHGNRGGHETGNFSTTLGWLDYYDIDADTWVTNLADAPNPRDHTGGAYVNGRICVTGGRDGGSVGFFNNVVLPTDCYDPATNTWSVEANIPQGRAGSSYGTTCDGKLMIAGGEGFGQAWSNVDVFDGTSWTTVDSLNIPRHGSGLAVDCICNMIHIASGSTIQGSSPTAETSSVETYFQNGVQTPCLA